MYYCPRIFFLSICCIYLSSVRSAVAVELTLAQNKKSEYAIFLDKSAIEPEISACREVSYYLHAVSGVSIPVFTNSKTGWQGKKILIGRQNYPNGLVIDHSKFDDEEWIIRHNGSDLILSGGRPRGTLYAVYRFLEDNVGVRWWSPWEEYIPHTNKLTVQIKNRQGKPAFKYRDIFMLYGKDNGKFASRNRINRDGDAPISAAYGGGPTYGLPYHVHTFGRYIPPGKYFDKHPDWFAEIGGKRQNKQSSNS